MHLRQQVVVEANLAVPLGHRREQHVEQRGKLPGLQTVEVVLAFAAALDQARHAQQCQMMAHCRLAFAEQLAQRPHVQLVALGQVVQNSQPGLVGKQLEELDEIVDQVVRNGQMRLLGRSLDRPCYVDWPWVP